VDISASGKDFTAAKQMLQYYIAVKRNEAWVVDGHCSLAL
jgi:hypothetical protein